MVIRIGNRRAVHGAEHFIIDHMILWGNKTGLEIADQSNSCRVTVRKPKELTGPRARFPLRDLVPVLEPRVENVSGATPNPKAPKMVAVETGTRKEFDGSKTEIRRSVIVDPRGMRHCKRPQARVKRRRPLKVAVDHHSPGIPNDRLNGSFGHAVLMVCADARKMKGLGQRLENISELGRSEDTIVGMIGDHSDAMLGENVFEFLLREDGIGTAKRNLVVHSNETGCVVDEDSASTKTKV